MTGPDTDEFARVVHELNVQTRATWRAGRRLAGGYRRGAYELIGADDVRAVLKWSPASDGSDDLPATARAVEKARRAGWPTPRWLSFGTLPSGSSYVLQEFIEGRELTALTSDADLGDRDQVALPRVNAAYATAPRGG